MPHRHQLLHRLLERLRPTRRRRRKPLKAHPRPVQRANVVRQQLGKVRAQVGQVPLARRHRLGRPIDRVHHQLELQTLHQRRHKVLMRQPPGTARQRELQQQRRRARGVHPEAVRQLLQHFEPRKADKGGRDQLSVGQLGRDDGRHGRRKHRRVGHPCRLRHKRQHGVVVERPRELLARLAVRRVDGRPHVFRLKRLRQAVALRLRVLERHVQLVLPVQKVARRLGRRAPHHAGRAQRRQRPRRRRGVARLGRRHPARQQQAQRLGREDCEPRNEEVRQRLASEQPLQRTQHVLAKAAVAALHTQHGREDERGEVAHVGRREGRAQRERRKRAVKLDRAGLALARLKRVQMAAPVKRAHPAHEADRARAVRGGKVRPALPRLQGAPVVHEACGLGHQVVRRDDRAGVGRVLYGRVHVLEASRVLLTVEAAQQLVHLRQPVEQQQRVARRHALALVRLAALLNQHAARVHGRRVGLGRDRVGQPVW
eukprot:Unigene5656_Nuclearia_a/m.17268 Unigene5656_Nuclearia_a/g.17268  ORF Unigene5656_Nuclearia_a/g.17268 Unigene5656_Nuclearia_a/m.17268 type:complete len:485 (-) Unigene5656_Nuclearia_a:946-2400(-)